MRVRRPVVVLEDLLWLSVVVEAICVSQCQCTLRIRVTPTNQVHTLGYSCRPGRQM